MSDLYLHIGHGKTGSSYIQSTLANSLDSIRDQGYVYPCSRGYMAAASGKISSGNGYEFEMESSQEVLGEKVIFSSENFFHLLRNGDDGNYISRIRGYGYDKIHLLMFIRDPIDHAPSGYQQSVKRGGKNWSVEKFFSVFQVPKLVAILINKVSQYDDVELTIKNYSRCKSNILTEFCLWSGLEESKLSPPPFGNVNRSLTRAELVFQKEINNILGQSGSLVSDPLVNNLPHIRPEVVLPSIDVQKEMLSRLSGDIEYVNQYVLPEDAYSTEVVAPVCDLNDEVYISEEQIRVIATRLGREIKELRVSQGKS